MSQDMYDERIRVHKPQMYAWEGQTADGVSFSDLNEKHIRGCIRLGVEGGRIPVSAMNAPIEDTLAKWKLLKNGVPTNGAAMLFSDNIDEYPQFRLRMARFVGTNKNEFIDNQRVEGGFFDLLDAGMAFFFKHLNLQCRDCSQTKSPPTGPKYDPSTTQVQQLIEFMGDGYIDVKGIMALFHLKSAKRFRENYIRPALADGTIERLYPDQPKHPKQKYRLTEAAKEWKANKQKR